MYHHTGTRGRETGLISRGVHDARTYPAATKKGVADFMFISIDYNVRACA